MPDRPFNVLFLSTGNSAKDVLSANVIASPLQGGLGRLAASAWPLLKIAYYE
jgi:hypothetical protein